VTQWKHIVWDWNGTLLADTRICVEVLNELMAEKGLAPITEDRYRETFDFPVIEFYRTLGFPTNRGAFESTSHDFIARYHARARQCPLHSGAKELLEKLSATACVQSILSAAQQDTLERSVREYELEDCFRHLIGAKDIFAHGKEEAGITWLQSHQLKPHEIVLVGDTLHDHAVARAMGIRCVLVAHGHHSRERLEQSGAPVVDGFDELEPWLIG